MNTVLIYGANGWIGQQLVNYINTHHADKFTVLVGKSRADDDDAVDVELDDRKPTHVISLVGRTHGPGFSTIDYLEQPGKIDENLRDNLCGPTTLAFACKARGIHYSYFGTGCIFNGATPDNTGYTEADKPNFFGSSYSVMKGMTDRLFHIPVLASNTLNLRIRMPITDTVSPRNFITKITTYDKICSIPNSMSVLITLFPCLIDMMINKTVGTVNFTNPGVISHNEILEMYATIVDPSFTWKNFTIEEQDTILASKRSNNYLNTSKLEAMYPDVPRIHDAVRSCLERMAGNNINNK